MSDQKFPITFLYMSLLMEGKLIFHLCRKGIGNIPLCTDRYFLDALNVNGEMHIRSRFQYGKELTVSTSIKELLLLVFDMQNCSGGVNQDCIAANPTEEWRCFMAQVIHCDSYNMLHELLPILQYTYPHIKTPIFMLNSRYDAYQILAILQLFCLPGKCTPDQINDFQDYGDVRH